MGSFLANTLDVNSDYQAGKHQAGNAYDPQVLQDELAKRNQIYGGQQDLAAMLQQNAAGGGPNPAQTQYKQNVNQNIANTQGLISSQRGLNPALAAKMGANAGAVANQQAASNAALLQQQQQLGAQNNLGNLYGQMQSGTMTQQGLYNQANLGAMQANVQQAAANQQAKQALVGGALGGIGTILGMSHGGQVPQYFADGGDVAGMAGTKPLEINPSTPGISSSGSGDGGALSYAGQFLNSMGGAPAASTSGLATGMAKFTGGIGGGGIIKAIKKKVGMDKPTTDMGFAGNAGSGSGGDAGGGMGGALGSPMGGGPGDAMGAGAEGMGGAGMMLAAHGGMAPHNLKSGGGVGGKPKVKGDSVKNDTVPAMLSPGEIVIPRSIAQGPDAPDKAAAFVAAILAKNGGMRRK